MLLYGVSQLLPKSGETAFRPYDEGAQKRIFTVPLQPNYPKHRTPAYRD